VFMNVTGRIVEAFSYNSIFIIMGFLHPLAYLVCRALVRPRRAAEPCRPNVEPVSHSPGSDPLPRAEGDSLSLP